MKKAIITIDTEAPVGNTPIESLIYGKTRDGKEFGIRTLIDLFDNYEFKGLFFVDIAEAWDYGEDKIARVIEDIRSAGHDVAVHIHPDHMADVNRRFLWEYSYDEQFEIIYKCTEFYKKVTGETPKSFRAGRYGANDETIKILDSLGYKYDFSEFPHNKRCRMSFDGIYNQIKKIRGTNIIEIPVSVFQSFQNPLYSRFDKIDVSQSLSEYKKAIDAISDDQIIVFFAHSFSFLKWRNDPNKPIFLKSEYKKTDMMLRYLRDKEIQVLDQSHLDNIRISDKHSDFIDLSSGVTQYFYFVQRSMKILHDKLINNV